MLVVRGVRKRFDSRPVLRGVDLRVGAGEILALVGENGAGKTTLVHCIARTLGADAGTVELRERSVPADPIGARDQGIAVVWQDLSLCDNLSAVANLFLGNERRGAGMLDEVAMVADARRLLADLGITIPNLLQPAGALSTGQRQLLAIARALVGHPAVLILDEPTASLGVNETRVVERLLTRLRSSGTAILLVSHRLEQVFTIADRIAVLRDGRIVAEVSPIEVHPDDVVAMIAGVEMDSTARRQLRRLRSLVEQLAEVEPAASLPLIVSAMAEALVADRLCVHLVETAEDGGRCLRRSAVVGLDGTFLDAIEALPIGEEGGPPGQAAATGQAVVLEDAWQDAPWCALVGADRSGPRSLWSVPIAGATGVIGTISGFGDTVGGPKEDQLELVSLYASHAAAAVDRERLLADATRRNRILESLRGVLDALAGPRPAEGVLGVALLALCRGLGADVVAVHTGTGQHAEYWLTDLPPDLAAFATRRQRTVAAPMLTSRSRVERARPIGDDILAVPIATPGGRVVVTAWSSGPEGVSDEGLDLLDDAARSLRLAFEREELEHASAEAASLRRSQRLQREFLSRLNHELRTPLTAIQGFASTLRQEDVSWDTESQQRFLDSIASESARMGRLVGDLLDFSAIDSGTLRLVSDWCDLGLVLEAARRCVPDAVPDLFDVQVAAEIPPVWADHDRMEQVFVNLFENAVRHGTGLSHVRVAAALAGDGASVAVRVADDGAGVPWSQAERMFLPHERGVAVGPGAGLGLAIARGVVEAHGGTIALEEVPVGTTVVVTLPVEPPASEDATIASATVPGAAG